MRQLTQQLGDDRRALGLGQVNAQEVDGQPRQSDGDADQGVERVAVERHGHQENGAHAEHQRVQQAQLRNAHTQTFSISFQTLTEDEL